MILSTKAASRLERDAGQGLRTDETLGSILRKRGSGAKLSRFNYPLNGTFENSILIFDKSYPLISSICLIERSVISALSVGPIKI